MTIQEKMRWARAMTRIFAPCAEWARQEEQAIKRLNEALRANLPSKGKEA